MRSWVLYEDNRERRCLCRNSTVLPYPPISEESFHLYFEAYQQVHLENSPLLEQSPGNLQADAYHLAPQSFARHMANLRAIRAAAPRALVSLDPSPFYMRPGGREQLAEVLALTDIALPSLEEVSSCFGPVSPEAAAEILLALGPSIVVIKMGAAGVYVRERSRAAGMRVPARQGAVTDTTGAGDAFCGGFLAGYLAERDAGYAACCGAVSASYAIADYGPCCLLEAGPGEARSRRDALLQQIGKQLRPPKNREG